MQSKSLNSLKTYSTFCLNNSLEGVSRLFACLRGFYGVWASGLKGFFIAHEGLIFCFKDNIEGGPNGWALDCPVERHRFLLRFPFWSEEGEVEGLFFLLVENGRQKKSLVSRIRAIVLSSFNLMFLASMSDLVRNGVIFKKKI
uniref:Uncharacterized protein n=1 Tax=Cucumis melo TaxID=3656 RepID=A0A9I9ED96_CUCME